MEYEDNRIKKPDAKKKIFFAALAASSEYVFHYLNKASESAKKLISQFPDYSDLNFEEIFTTYSELMYGKELSYNIDSAILEYFLRYTVKKSRLI